jgi:membrane glycosyltransferase
VLRGPGGQPGGGDRGWQALAVLRLNSLNVLKVAIFGLFIVLLVPAAVGFWTAATGFVIQWWDGWPMAEPRSDGDRNLKPAALPRTAVVMPAYNEDPVRMLSGLRATYESLEQTGCLEYFDLFVLSDTTDPDIWVREEVAFTEMRKSVSDPERLHYRNRRENVERKTGNIADFCATWGDGYRYMIVFDADSIMTGASLVSLVQMMERYPRVGIVQAPPLPVNRHTLFGRVQQFATRAFSPMFMAGLNFWQGGAGDYWGHNAIIRMRPFMKHCRLPRLPGPEPLGGSILSHDFVEAAFMRRAGWRVYLASGLWGSYEETPPSMITYAARDRRWCQGNLQHTRLLLTPGLHFVNRLHLGMGVMSYLACPLWLLLLLLSTIEGLKETLSKHEYFPAGHALFPIWKISPAQQSLLLFSAVVAVLLLPKLFSLLLRLGHPHRVAGFGGWLKFVSSVLLETLFSTLLAPILAMLQTRFVVGFLMGKNVRWEAQTREDTATTFSEAFPRHWLSSLIGVAWSGLLWFTAPQLLWWFSPVLIGLVLAVPMSAWTSRTDAGEWAQAHGLFLTPEEVAPPGIIKRLEEELQKAAGRPWAVARDGLGWVVQDRAVAELHLALLLPESEPCDPLRQHYLEGLRFKLHHSGLEALSKPEKRDLLLDADSVRALQLEAPEPTSVLRRRAA